MTHDLCYLLLFIIGTSIKFNHTNSAIHSSGHSRGPFASASDYASAQWRLLLHILVTCFPHFNKWWVTRDIYGSRCGWSHWPIIIQHVRALWRSAVSWRACSTGTDNAVRVSRSIGSFLMDLKIVANFDYWIKRMTCWCVISLQWFRKMAVHKCHAFRLKREKFSIAHPWCLLSVVGLEENSAHDWWAATSVERAPVTWREWGLWPQQSEWSVKNKHTKRFQRLKCFH